MEKTRKIRIGIDVGGTFTDAVAIDQEDFSIVSHIKTPTTHDAAEGVAKGVIDSLMCLMKEGNIKAEEVSFIAHGTTQATNALLEGDVEKVGIFGMGQGIEGLKAKPDTVLGAIEVSKGKCIETESVFMDTTKGIDPEEAKKLIDQLQQKECRVIVASEAFSVDRPDNELEIQKICMNKNINVTGGHEISKLYGLKSRTRTSVINASILSKMMNTANMTQKAVVDAKIETPLMIMRCDGGVMKVDEIKKRPILTILSGPAAGVAGALMYERVSDGIFLEVGGTSTDISAIKNGKVMVSYAEVGGHKTYVTSLDVRTVGIGGGSMVAVENKKVKTVGPRSAHIAHCGYCVYADTEVIRNGELKFIHPLKGDTDQYATIVGSDGKSYAITLSCAANVLGYIKEGDYAAGNIESAKAGIKKLADYCGTSLEKVSRDIIDAATAKNAEVVKKLIKDYQLDSNIVILTGGGGGASGVIWPLAESLKMKAQLAKNAPIISTIGAALAMVRDVVERTIINPTDEDILKIRSEAEYMAIASGANPSTVEVSIEIDASLNRVRAIAIGTTELVRKTLGISEMDEEGIKNEAAKVLQTDLSKLTPLAKSDFFRVFTIQKEKKGFWSIFKRNKANTCVLDTKGIVKLNVSNAETETVVAEDLKKNAPSIIKKYAYYDESGERTPDLFLLIRSKIVDLKGIPTMSQLGALIETEAKMLEDDEPVILITIVRS